MAVTGACVSHPVGPARTAGKYEGKAVSTAESALSNVQSVRLATRAGSDGHAFGPYLSITVSEQEDALSGVEGTFGSIQPPDSRSDDLRDELLSLLSDASDHVGVVRIAVRRGQLDDLARVADPLGADAEALSAFVDEHGS